MSNERPPVSFSRLTRKFTFPRGTASALGGGIACACLAVVVKLLIENRSWGSPGTGTFLACLAAAALLFIFNFVTAVAASLRERTRSDLLAGAWALFLPQVMFWLWLLVANAANSRH